MTNLEHIRKMNAMELAYFILNEAPKIAEQYVPIVNGLAAWLDQDKSANTHYENNALNNNAYNDYMSYLSPDMQLLSQDDEEE